MNTDTGIIREITEQNPPTEKEIMLNEMERRYLEMMEAAQRPELLKQLRSKNNAAKRRARKKIAKASRQRNRR